MMVISFDFLTNVMLFYSWCLYCTRYDSLHPRSSSTSRNATLCTGLSKNTGQEAKVVSRLGDMISFLATFVHEKHKLGSSLPFSSKKGRKIEHAKCSYLVKENRNRNMGRHILQPSRLSFAYPCISPLPWRKPRGVETVVAIKSRLPGCLSPPSPISTWNRRGGEMRWGGSVVSGFLLLWGALNSPP